MSDKLNLRTESDPHEFEDLKKQLEQLDIDSITQIVLRQQQDLQKSLNTLRAEETYDWTGLVGKKGFQVAMNIEMHDAARNGTPISIVNMDLKKFKDINDNDGYTEGDEVLKTFANFLSKNTRINDIPVHLSGDEFLVVLPNTNQQGAEEMAENLEKRLEQAKKNANLEDRIHKIDFRFRAGEWDSKKSIAEYLDSLDAKRFEEKRE